MNWQKLFVTSSFIWAFVFLVGCGVKGDPVPPTRPADLGRGRPTYRRATKGISIQNHKKVEKYPNEEEDGEPDENSEE